MSTSHPKMLSVAWPTIFSSTTISACTRASLIARRPRSIALVNGQTCSGSRIQEAEGASLLPRRRTGNLAYVPAWSRVEMNWFVLDGKKPPVQHKPALDQPGTYADFDAATAREEGSDRAPLVCRVHPPAVDLPTAIVVLRSKSRHLFAFMTITGSVHTTKQVVSQERRLDFIFNPIGVLTNGSTIAFRTATSEASTESTNMALCDALAATRRPSISGQGGLVWHLPRIVLVDPSNTNSCLEKACAELAITATVASTQMVADRSRTVQLVRRFLSIPQLLSPHGMAVSKFELVFDRSLSTIQKIEPRRAAKLSSESFSHLRGFSQDPATMLPALRWLLPVVEARIADGSVLHRGLHYTHELLELWPGRLAQTTRVFRSRSAGLGVLR